MPESYPGGDLREGAYIHLEVSDTGCGMTAETRSRIFDPFFTTKFTGRGLGLAAVLGIVRGHHGLIRVRSMPGEGSTFDVFLPTFNGPSSSETVSASSRTWQGTGTVLVVDDEEPIRGMAEVMLGRMGFSVLLAEDGLAAIEKFQEHLAQIDLVLLDLTMPGLDGVETFRELRCLDPRVRVILSSGYGEDEAAKRLGNPKPAGFVAKPYELDSLRQVVRKVFEDGDS